LRPNDRLASGNLRHRAVKNPTGGGAIGKLNVVVPDDARAKALARARRP